MRFAGKEAWEKYQQEQASKQDQPSIPIKEQPVLFVIGGGPGSGKSTLTKWLKHKGVLHGEFVTLTLGTFVDLPEFRHIAETTKHPHPEKSPTLIDEYYYLRDRIFEECVKRGVSLVVDEHLDHPNEDNKLLDAAQKAGYLKVLVGMTITPVDYFNDVRDLIGRKGIDHTHTSWALNIHKQFAERWEEIVKKFDVSFLYQKNYSQNHPVALVADEDNVLHPVQQYHEIIDERRYEVFQNWQNINLDATNVKEAFPRGSAEEFKDYFDRVGKDTHIRGDGGGKDAWTADGKHKHREVALKKNGGNGHKPKPKRGWDVDARPWLERVRSAAKEAILARKKEGEITPSDPPRMP